MLIDVLLVQQFIQADQELQSNTENTWFSLSVPVCTGVVYRKIYSRPSVGRTVMDPLPWLLRTRSYIPWGKNPIAADLG